MGFRGRTMGPWHSNVMVELKNADVAFERN